MVKLFRNLSIGARLIFSFGGAVLLLVVLAGFTLVESRRVRAAAEEVAASPR